MTPREAGFLLLSSSLGDPRRRPLTTAQLRNLAVRMAAAERPEEDRELAPSDLTAMGYGREMAEKILLLLGDEPVLNRYIARAEQANCIPVTRVSPGYPGLLRQRLDLDSPGVLWAKGNLSILERRAVALVGSRDIRRENGQFAARVGREAARQGFVLVSGNARGADRIAQKACLDAGGQIISVVADELAKQEPGENVLYLSEDGFDLEFSALRALSRNRVIHALGEKTFVAQCGLETGGTWSGTVRNLKEGFSPVFCFRDGSEAMSRLTEMGAEPVEPDSLTNFQELEPTYFRLF